MSDKIRELSRASATRSDYAQDADELQQWLGGAEAAAQERDARPHQLKEKLKVNYSKADSGQQVQFLPT